MKQFSHKWLNGSRVPLDLDSVISIDRELESDPNTLGVSPSAVDEIWQKAIKLYQTGMHPAITLNIRRRGEVLMSRAIGHSRGNGPKDNKNLEKHTASTDTPFCVFSASKAVSGLLIHILAEEGKVNIMDPVSYYCPDFTGHGKEFITLHHILSHRGGVPGLPANISFSDLFNQKKIWRHLCKSKPITTDGSKLAYHLVSGGFVLEQVVENVTGGTMDDYLNEKIRKPMGFKYFTFGARKEHLNDLAQPYMTGPQPGTAFNWLAKRALGLNITTLAKLIDDPRFHETVVPSANLIANSHEMSAFFQMMLDGGRWEGKAICRPDTVARAVQPYGEFTFDRTMMMPMRYSAGFMLGGSPVGAFGPNTAHVYGHVGLANKFCWADPERETSVSLLTSGISLVSNHLPALVKLLSAIGHQIPRECVPEPFHFSNPDG